MANTPVNKDLYNRVKAEAKRKFKSWPSAYGSAWLVKEYKKRGGKYRTSSKQFGGMSDTALDKMQTFYKDLQANKYNPSLMQNSLDDLSYFNAINPRQTYLKKIKEGTKSFKLGDKEITYGGKKVYKGPGLFSQDPYVLDKNINIQTHFGPQGQRLYKNIYELDQPGFSTTGNLGYGDDVPEGTRYMMDIYGNDYSVRPPEMKTGGIPERYKNMGFTKVGAKKQSTRPGKKWMVLAKKGDDYKVVHGGDNKMQDFKQHGSAKRKKRFWDRMGGRDSAKANDPFSPLYWHKRFGTWQEGGQFIYDPNNPMPQFEMGNSILDKMKRETMRKGGQPCYECGGMYATGGTNNPGFRALPPHVQQKIRANMNSGGMTPFNADPNYYGERLEKFIGNIRNTAAENLFPDMEEEVMQMPQARYGMPIYQGDVYGSEVNEDAFRESVLRGDTYVSPEDQAAMIRARNQYTTDQGGTRQDIGNYSAILLQNGNYAIMYNDKVIYVATPEKLDYIKNDLAKAPAPTFGKNYGSIPGLNQYLDDELIMVPEAKEDQRTILGPLGPEDNLYDMFGRGINMLAAPFGQGTLYDTNPNWTNYANAQGAYTAQQINDAESGLIGSFMLPAGSIESMAANAPRAFTPRALLTGRPGIGAGRGVGTSLMRNPQAGLAQYPGRVPNLGSLNFRNPNSMSPGLQALLGLNPADVAPLLSLGERVANAPDLGNLNQNQEAIMDNNQRSAQTENQEVYDPNNPQYLTSEELANVTDWVNENLQENLEEDNDETSTQTSSRSESGSNSESIPTSVNDSSSPQTSDENVEDIEDIEDSEDSEDSEEDVDLYENTQGMYSDPDTGLVMNVPQQYFGQQYMPQYPQYNNPYLQRAQYKFGPLGRNLRRVDLQYGIPGQQSMVPADFAANAANVTPEAIIEGMQNSGMISPREGRRAMKKAIKEMRQASKDKLSGMREASRDLDREERMTNKAARFENRMQRRSDRINDRFDRKAERIQNRQERRSNNEVNNYSAPQPDVAPPAAGSYRGPNRNVLQRRMKEAGINYEDYQLYQLPDGQYEYRPNKMYGGSNPYLYAANKGNKRIQAQNGLNVNQFGNTPEEQRKINAINYLRETSYPDKHNRLRAAMDDKSTWEDENINDYFAGVPYPKQAALDSMRTEWKNLQVPPEKLEALLNKKMYGGANPYLYMYKQGGEYYMDEDTINMILAMGGDIEFLD